MDISNASAYQTAYQGVKTGFDDLNESTKKIAHPNHHDKIDSLIEQKASEKQVQSSAKALKTADDMIGTLLDITV